MKKIIYFLLLIFVSMGVVNASGEYYNLKSIYSHNSFIDMPVAYELKDGKHLLAGYDGVKFIELIDKNGTVLKRTDLSGEYMSFYNIYKLNGYYYLYGGNSVNFFYFKIDNNLNVIEENKLSSFSSSKPFLWFEGYKEDTYYYYDFSYGLKINKKTAAFEKINANEYPSYLSDPHSVVKNQVSEDSEVKLIWLYRDGFAILYRNGSGTSTNRYFGYVVDNELKWSKPVGNITIYNIDIYSDYIAIIGYEEAENGYVFKLYDELGNIVSNENFSQYHHNRIEGVHLRGGKDYLNVSVSVPISSDSSSSMMYFFKNENYNYNIYLEDVENGTVTSSKLRAISGEKIRLDTLSDEGYVLGDIKVLDEDGKYLDVSNNEFIMPASNVIVTANFIVPTSTENDPQDNNQDPDLNGDNLKDEENPFTSSQSSYYILSIVSVVLLIVGIYLYRKL